MKQACIPEPVPNRRVLRTLEAIVHNGLTVQDQKVIRSLCSHTDRPALIGLDRKVLRIQIGRIVRPAQNTQIGLAVLEHRCGLGLPLPVLCDLLVAKHPQVRHIPQRLAAPNPIIPERRLPVQHRIAPDQGRTAQHVPSRVPNQGPHPSQKPVLGLVDHAAHTVLLQLLPRAAALPRDHAPDLQRADTLAPGPDPDLPKEPALQHPDQLRQRAEHPGPDRGQRPRLPEKRQFPGPGQAVGVLLLVPRKGRHLLLDPGLAQDRKVERLFPGLDLDPLKADVPPLDRNLVLDHGRGLVAQCKLQGGALGLFQVIIQLF
ncbi:hypothetical protein LSTR_LSTR017455 [Laodelphax striatellus]|uniref:Uncharacterized protein n=1 Tax=Laodelphax striatellus TaxID=195883 RepID=A0A482XGC3_LAOST|nr:hypothetical protein LSTR_LSTR017455 [Laodelphax striatellus]